MKNSKSSVIKIIAGTAGGPLKGWLIYHPKRVRSTFNNITVYHDHINGNQDPYVWQSSFLHTFCHMSQMNPEPVEDDIILWVSSGDDAKYPRFTQLLCDLVFVVRKKVYWDDANKISRSDPIVESSEAYADHYRWANVGHHYKYRRRFTLKSSEEQSFQAQTMDHRLFNIAPLLEDHGVSLPELRTGLYLHSFISRPMIIDWQIAEAIRKNLATTAPILLRGKELGNIRKTHPEILASPPPKLTTSCSKPPGRVRKRCC